MKHRFQFWLQPCLDNLLCDSCFGISIAGSALYYGLLRVNRTLPPISLVAVTFTTIHPSFQAATSRLQGIHLNNLHTIVEKWRVGLYIAGKVQSQQQKKDRYRKTILLASLPRIQYPAGIEYLN